MLLVAYRHTYRRLQVGARTGFWVVALSGAATGIVWELSLATGGEGTYGGLHAETAKSFLLAPGCYLPAGLLTAYMIRQYRLRRRRAFVAAGAMWWAEVLFAFPFGFTVLPYYVTVYALFGVAALSFVDEPSLHAETAPQVSTRRLVGYGMIAGAVAWSVFGAWYGVLALGGVNF